LYDAENDKFSWCENEEPRLEDLNNFVLFYDSVGKRNFKLHSIGTSTLQSWKNKEYISLYIHKYSNSAAKLKEKNLHRFAATRAAWLIWESVLLLTNSTSTPEEVLNSDIATPPPDIIHHFTLAQVNEAVWNQVIQ
ncbi:hypothetical protein HK096_001496, partial [Nowakowskiella sp. JEL0078]